MKAPFSFVGSLPPHRVAIVPTIQSNNYFVVLHQRNRCRYRNDFNGTIVGTPDPVV